MKMLAVYQELGLAAVAARSAGSIPDAGGRHVFHHHPALWDYCDPALAHPYAAGMEAVELFASPPPGTTFDEAMRRTRLLVFLGADDSPEFRAAIARSEGVCLVLEPDLERLDAFMAAVKPHTLAGKGVFFIGGDPDALDVPLLSMLPEDLCDQGYPLFFALEGLTEALPEYARRVEELVELFYYRTILYPLEGQDNIRGMPLRPMTRNATYDRCKHHYENLSACLRSGVLSDLLGAFTGHAAILCAAGPALAESIGYIRRNRDRAVVIAVNNALKPLLAAGINPHFVVINDTSIGSGRAFDGVPPLEDTALVAHCLSYSGGDAFPRAYFFGNFPGQPFPRRDSLLLHGSVITTAFSLAEYLGCSKAILAGVQLSSPDPYSMNYVAGSQHENNASGVSAPVLKHRWPEFYPARAADGSVVYTTLNFFDAAQWFADRIVQASLEVVNLCPTSILRGEGITFETDPELAESPGLGERFARLPRTDLSDRRHRVLDYIRQEMAQWKARQMEARQAACGLDAARDFIVRCDLDGSAYMLQRFDDFDNRRFHAGYFDAATPQQRMEAAMYFVKHMENMSGALLRILLSQHAAISGKAGS